MSSESLPLSLPEPKWLYPPERQLIATKYGTLSMAQMADDDVYVEGDLTYRGNTYRVRYEHTTLEGLPKGYAGNGQDYGVVEADWQRARFFEPHAPKTYVGPLLDAVREAVVTYLSEHAEHASASLHAHKVQDQNRKASDYNRKAKELAELLAKYEAIQP
jgi:hypothetical protein